MKSGDFTNLKKLLLRRRAFLLKADHDIDKEIKDKAEYRHGDDADIAESAYEQEMAYLFKSRGQDEVRYIDEALKRIAKGEYGQCAECGEKISSKRLAAQPYSILCIGCQEATERTEQKNNSVFQQ